jgi:peptidoglycan hydrolase-like protein with peptidoglycan-binding domain
MAAAEIDTELATALKAAKQKQMNFVFIAKGSADGKLIVSRKKIPPKDIAEAKKEFGNKVYSGKCVGAGAEMVFTVVKDPGASVATCLRNVAKTKAGIALKPVFKEAADAEADAPEDGAPGAPPAPGAPGMAPPASPPPVASMPPAATPPAAPPSPPSAAGGDEKIRGVQKALKKLGYDPGEPDGIMGPHTQGAIKKFQQASGLAADGIAGPKTQAALAKALQGGGAAPPADPSKTPPAAPPAPPAPDGGKVLPSAPHTPPAPPASIDFGPWQAARQVAITDLKALAAKVAGTKHPDAVGVVKEISAVIAKLPAAPKPTDIDKLEAFIRTDESITAAEASPKHFHDLIIRQPLLEALEALRQ